MEFNGIQWISIDLNGFQWNSMEFNGFQWNSMDFNGFLDLYDLGGPGGSYGLQTPPKE